MPFRIINVPTTSMNIMYTIFKEHMAQNLHLFFMDDILVFSKNEEQHKGHLEKVFFKGFERHSKRSKSQFFLNLD